MNIYLKSYAKRGKKESIEVLLEERLPFWIQDACRVMCDIHIDAVDNYYLIHLHARASLMMTCQRCAQPFCHEYTHQSIIAACPNEMVAESLMSRYECIVHQNESVNLCDILTDELYLFSPEKHDDEALCSG